MKIFLEYFEKFFGKEITFAMIFVVAGWFGNSYINNTFMTNEAYADHHEEIFQKIDKSAIAQDTKLLMYEKRGLIQQRTQVVIEMVKNPSMNYLQQSLNSIDQSLKEIDDTINNNNVELAK